MPETVNDLVLELQKFVDVDPATALSALNRRNRQAAARARSRRERLEIGPTVAGTSFYAVSGVVEVLEVSVAGAPYGKGRRGDIFGYSQGWVVWEGPAGLVVADASSGAVPGITLVPAPTDSGLSIELFAAVFPPDLSTGDATSTLAVDPDFYDVLVDGAAATWLRRQGEGDPEGMEGRFFAACEEMRARVNQRFRSSGPSQIRVQGLNA